MRLGEILDRVKADYGQNKLKAFAKAIGANCDKTLARHRSVYRKWKGKEAPGPISFSVGRALQNHPDRVEIVKRNPTITKREAEKLAQEHRKKAKPEKQGWSADEARRWCKQVSEHA